MPPWVEWIASYHALLRCAFAVRAAVGPAASGARGARLASLDLSEVAFELRAREGVDVDASLLSRLVTPEHGRTVGAVLEELARRFAIELPTVEQAILPTRRRR